MKKDTERSLIDQLVVNEDEDISESVEYIKHVFGSIMDIIFEDDNTTDKCKECDKKLV